MNKQKVIKLRDSKQINKPRVKITLTANGYAYAVLCEDTFKLTREPMGYLVFAYVWAVPPSLMLKSLHDYLELKGLKN